MTQTVTDVRRSFSRKSLMMGCASAALAAAVLWPQAARAQAFQGSITSSNGSVSRSTPTTTTETLTIGTNTATINWSPANQQQGGGPLNFLPAGNTATFTSAPGVTDYTVLNRILPDSGQSIALNGHVISTLQGTNTTGGHVWFYAPNGIVVGATAVFDVGGLLLTTNDVTSFGTTANGFNASFSAPSGSASAIQIQSGAQINALQKNSYVALVAPRIEQGGQIRVNGSAAYAAAEQLSMTMNQGLFDIQVDVGTADGNGIVHTGETSGPANTAAGDNHSIYMVAVPKNQALTMLLSGGRIGFGDAVSAELQNGQIVLSSGYNVFHDDSGNPFFAGLDLGDAIGGEPASINITGGKFSSSVRGAAIGDILASGGSGVLEFDGNLNLQALGSSTLLARSGDTITVGGSATISADDFKFGAADSEGTNVDAHGGIASIESDSGGSITIAGDTLVTAFGRATVNTATNYGGTATGGIASIDANGGSISIGGNTRVLAIAIQGGTDTGFDGRDSFGGSAQVTASDGGSIAFAGSLEVNADGDGSFSALSSGGTGGSGIGGYAAMTADSDASIHVGGDTIVSATGYGGAIINSSDGTNGTGQGGEVDLAATNGGTLSFGSRLALSASGFGNPFGNPTVQTPQRGGQGEGGTANLFVDGGNLTVTGDLGVFAVGVGGSGIAQGGSGDGGSATIGIFGGSASFTGSAVIDVSSFGGNASNGVGGSAGLDGESIADIETFGGGNLIGGNVTVNANATGGNALTAGAAAAGEIDIFADSFDSDASANIALHQLSLSANGTTGVGAPADEIGSSGGFVSLATFGGTITANSLAVQANGTNIGGELALEADTNGSGQPGSLHFGSVDAQANGGDFGGFILAATGSGSNIDLGDATLGTSGAFGGSIFIVAGTCAECGGFGDSQTGLGEAALPAGGGIAANNLTLNSTGNIFVDLSSGADVSVTGTLNGSAGQFISLVDDGTGGAIRAHEIDLSAFTIDDSADIVADIIRFSTPSSMFLGNLSATDSIELTAGGDLTTGDLTAGRIDLSGDNIAFGNLTGDHTSFDAAGSVSGGNITATNRASGNAEGPVVLGNITAGPNLPSGDEFSVGISSATSITVGNVTGAGHVGFATLGDLTTGNLSAGDLVMLLVSGDISTGSITTASNGRVYIADSSMFLTGGGGGEGADNHDNFDPNVVLALTPVATGGSITIGGPVTTGRLQAAAGGDLTLGGVTAGTDVTLSASGLAKFEGTVSSPTITVTSSDIDITEGASLGASGVTNLLTLNAISHGLPIIIGNDGSSEGSATGQYHLDEDGDINATSVVINAQGAVAGFNPDVQVFDVNVEGSHTSNVTLNTGGSVFVNGKVGFTDAGASDSLTINAGHVIEVNTDTGGIQITDSTGALAGTLNLKADNIWIASGSLLTQLEGDVNFAGRDAALATDSGTPNQDGFVRAGTITTGVADSLLVQNSGTPDLFAGIDTGAGGLSIANTGTTPTTLIVFGRQTTDTGTVITNQDFIGSVDLSGTGGFTDNSSVNGCTIGSTNCGQQTAFIFDMASILGPLDETNSTSDEDKKKKDKEGDESDDGSSADPSLRLINATPINNAPPIEEPVTSGGDVVIGGGPVRPN